MREHAVFVEGRPHPKDRPRFNRATGGVYTPPKTVAYEKLVADAWLKSKGPKYPEGIQLAVFITLDDESAAVHVAPIAEMVESKLAGDIDNYVKAILDGLNGVAWDDDVQVMNLTAVKG